MSQNTQFQVRHGGARRGAMTREYHAWRNARQRCTNPKSINFMDYGGRGIAMVPRWAENFAVFLADMGPCPPGYQIERTDNDGPYAPWNCCWATPKMQARNRRNSRLLTFAGETLCLSAWAERTGMPWSRIAERLALGWSVERALTAPPGPQANRNQRARTARTRRRDRQRRR